MSESSRASITAVYSMKPSISFLRQNESEAIFQIARFSDISQDIVDSIGREYPGKTIIFRPRTPLFEDFVRLERQLSEKTFCQIGFIAQTSRQAGPAPATPANLRCRPPRSPAELQHLLARTYNDDFAKQWVEYLGASLTQENLRILLAVSNPMNTAIVEDGCPAGMIVFFQATDCLGAPLEQVGWVWVRDDLQGGERESVHRLLHSALTRRRARMFQAGVHLKNRRSQRFFIKFGFKPHCIHCVPWASKDKKR